MDSDKGSPSVDQRLRKIDANLVQIKMLLLALLGVSLLVLLGPGRIGHIIREVVGLSVLVIGVVLFLGYGFLLLVDVVLKRRMGDSHGKAFEASVLEDIERKAEGETR